MADPMKVFVSYSWKDKEVALRLIAELEALQIEYYFDQGRVGWGQRIESEVDSAMRECTHLLLVVSKSSYRSFWVPYELGLARSYGLKVLPFLVDEKLKIFPYLKGLSYKTDPSSISEFFATQVDAQASAARNPKPYAIGVFSVDDVYLMFGNYTSPFPLNVRYLNEPLDPLSCLSPAEYQQLKELTESHARELGAQYFNGPNTRLIRFTEEGTRQFEDGYERKGVTLELGPVSWEEYSVLNTHLDLELGGGGTLRQRFGSREELIESDRDLSWCKLGTILSMGMIPITSDGFGLIQRRNPRGVSTEGGRFTSGLAENIHRYLDEAPENDLYDRLHPMDLPSAVASSGKIGVDYAPAGIPSPYLAVKRGIWEEISESIGDEISMASIHFLNIGFEFSKFHPVLMGVVELGLAKVEVERRRRVSPGRDHSEFLDIHYLRLDQNDKQTFESLKDVGSWIPGGRAALITAIHYWQANHRRSDRR